MSDISSYSKVIGLVASATSNYLEFIKACDSIAKIAQKYIDWDDSVGCEHFPGDGVCITVTAPSEYFNDHELAECVCPAMSFFDYIYENDISKISYKEFKPLCI